ncbi:protein of unknown function DUF3700 [Dillenia turbinata]|uniref:DUF3700 domain-containing protein n=1 Tax=Dillenia turbinata TaxID=194707 RepID=A0AAN8VMX9_9MAGN
MLAIFNKGTCDPPRELNSPASMEASMKPKNPHEILNEFMSSKSSNAFSLCFANASLAFLPNQSRNSLNQTQRMFCGSGDIYCIFLGSLNNLSILNKQYGLSKNGDEAMFVIEAYRTLRDRGPYPADQVLKELEGRFGFVVFDSEAGTVFVALGANEGVRLFWGIAADGSVVISDDLEVIKRSCAKSFAPFPAGCMFHSEGGLKSFEHPMHKLKAMSRIDSEGTMCGANFKVDVYSRASSMPRVGSSTNWAAWGSQA